MHFNPKARRTLIKTRNTQTLICLKRIKRERQKSLILLIHLLQL